MQKGTEDHGHCAGLWEAPGCGLRLPLLPAPPSLDVLSRPAIPPGLGVEPSEAAAGITSYPGGSRRGCGAPGTRQRRAHLGVAVAKAARLQPAGLWGCRLNAPGRHLQGRAREAGYPWGGR